MAGRAQRVAGHLAWIGKGLEEKLLIPKFVMAGLCAGHPCSREAAWRSELSAVRNL